MSRRSVASAPCDATPVLPRGLPSLCGLSSPTIACEPQNRSCVAVEFPQRSEARVDAAREGLSPCSQSFTWEPSVVLPAPGGDVAHTRVGSLRSQPSARRLLLPLGRRRGVRDLAGVCEGGWAVCSSWGWRALAVAVATPPPGQPACAPVQGRAAWSPEAGSGPQAVSWLPSPGRGGVVGPRLRWSSALAEPGAMGASVTSHCP